MNNYSLPQDAMISMFVSVHLPGAEGPAEEEGMR
jgi:hypothetical protein